MLNIPLMKDNINNDDIECLIDFLKDGDIVTQNKRVHEFEETWSK